MIYIKMLIVIILIFTNFLSINLIISLLKDSKKQNEEIERLQENNRDMQIEMARTWKKNDKLQEEVENLQSFARTNYEALEKKNKKIVELEKQIKGE